MAKILVIDDESGYLELLGMILRLEGHDVRTTDSPAEAIEIGCAFRPDVLLTDWKLKSDLCGVDVARKLVEANQQLVTIMMTGYSSGMLRKQAPDLPNLHVLEKPFDTDILRDMIHEAIEARA